MLINGIDLNQDGLCVKLSKVKLCSRQFKQDHSTYKKQVQNVQTNVPAPVKRSRHVRSKLLCIGFYLQIDRRNDFLRWVFLFVCPPPHCSVQFVKVVLWKMICNLYFFFLSFFYFFFCKQMTINILFDNFFFFYFQILMLPRAEKK